LKGVGVPYRDPERMRDKGDGGCRGREKEREKERRKRL
jgi:hypothetical protein